MRADSIKNPRFIRLPPHGIRAARAKGCRTKIARMRRALLAVATLLFAFAALAQSPSPARDVQQYVKFAAPVFALTHVRVIDGTGAPPKEDQTIVVNHGRVAAVGPFASTPVPAGVQALEFRDHTVIPGLVGLHNHLYYTASLNRHPGGLVPPGFFISEIPYSAPHLYLAAGVTTIRTTGSLEPYTDLFVKNLIDTNQMPGPKMDATAPYLEGASTTFPQMHPLTGANDARRFVTFWADTGFTSWKAYMNITREELATAVAEIHKRGQKIAGHLCSVTWLEAAALGIDDLEHGPVYTATDFVPDKQPDKCAESSRRTWANLDINTSPQVQGLIKDLIAHHVAVTSTLPVFEASLVNRPPNPRALRAMSLESRSSFLAARALVTPETNANNTALLKKEMEFEHAFAKAGGLLLAGPDPTGNGGVLPGFGDWRELELLVEAGFTPLEAIHIYTQNGAQYLGRDNIGTIAPGKAADLVVIDGNPAANIEDVEKTVLVFKDGVGYDSAKLFESVRGQVGIR